MTDAEKQEKYAASRHRADIPRPATVEYRVTLRDGRVFTEHVTGGLTEIAVLWPLAVKVERMDAGGGFW